MIDTRRVIEQVQSDQKEELVKKAAKKLNVPYMDARNSNVALDLLMLPGAAEAANKSVVPIKMKENNLLVGVLNNSKDTNEAVDQFEKESGHFLEPVFISEDGMQNIINQFSRLPQKPKDRPIVTKEKGIVLPEPKILSLDEVLSLVSQKDTEVAFAAMLAAAVVTKSSDIHLEPAEKNASLRFRIDGVLHDIGDFDKKLYEQLLSRIKFYAHLKLNVGEPQDGRIQGIYRDREIDFRVGTMPTIHGESVAIRVLKTEGKLLKLEDLGLSDYDLALIKKHISRPKGMILTTGPTGSGKTTTLYAILNILNKPEVSVVTLEDPVEYLLPGVTQSPVNEKAGYGFPEALRASLRHDPNVIMIGEVRDAETAEIAFRAALTGHIALSTYHAGEAVGAIPSLIEMGVRPFLAASALNIVIAQRLVRKVHNVCKKPDSPNPSLIKEVQSKLAQLPAAAKPKKLEVNFSRGAGCDGCQGLGYQGQIGIYEILEITPEIIRLSTANAPLREIQRKALTEGMVSMEQDGLLKAVQGITTLEEVWRVIGSES